MGLDDDRGVPSIAITVRLPWAAAIGAEVKTIENRGRPVHHRHIGQRAAIHAARTWCRIGARDPRVNAWWWQVRPDDFPGEFGSVLAVATIAGCHEAAQPAEPEEVAPGVTLMISQPGTCCEPWGDRRYGLGPAWHIVLSDVVRLPEPVPAIGKVAVPWTLPEAVSAAIGAQLQAVAP